MSLDERLKQLNSGLQSFSTQEYYNECGGENAQNHEFDFHQRFGFFRDQYSMLREELNNNSSESGEQELRKLNDTLIEKRDELESLCGVAKKEFKFHRAIIERVEKYRAPIQKLFDEDTERLEKYRARFESLKRATAFFDSLIEEFEIDKTDKGALENSEKDRVRERGENE